MEMEMNKQEIFNTAWNGLKAQGFVRSGKFVFIEEEVFRCLYRGPNGLKCALGFLIPDEKYKKSIENESPFDNKVKRALGLTKEAPYDFINWLSTLQSCHDEGDTPEHMEERLRMFAADNNLAVPE